MWVKARTSQIWLSCLNPEIWKLSPMLVTSRLNSNKQVVAEVARAFKAETKSGWYLDQVNSSKKSTPDIYRGEKPTNKF